MLRVLLIGNHPEFKCALETFPELAGCKILTAAGNVHEMFYSERGNEVLLIKHLP